MAITHADSKTDNKIPDIARNIPEIKEEIKKPNTKEEIDLEKADKPLDLWETFLERRKMQGAGDARYGNVHETGMEQKPVSDKTYIGKPDKESNEDDK
mgnify:CR=1 FL=1|tara:strand:+ start:199 stop:492 length:294 start_codon:yes stop_codon:yes gene_type:complete